VVKAAHAYKAEVDRAAQAHLTTEEVSALSRLAYTTSLTDSNRGIAASKLAVEVSKGLGDALLQARAEILAAAFRLLHDRWRNEDAEICARTVPITEQLGAKDIQLALEILYPAQALILQGQYFLALNAEDKVRNMTGRGLIGNLGAWGKSLALLH